MIVLLFGSIATPILAAEHAGIRTFGPIPASNLTALHADGSITLTADGKEAKVVASDLVAWGRFSESERGPLMILSDGSWLVAELVDLSADECRVDARLLGEIAIPRSALRGILLRLPAERAARDRLIDRIATRKDPHDLLLLANGDELAGRATRNQFHADTREESLLFTVAGAKEPATIGLHKVAAIAFDSALVDDATPRGKHTLVGLRDGSRLVASAIAARAKASELTLGAGVKVRLDADALASDVAYCQPLGHGVVYLSDLRTAGYKHIPFLTTSWPYHNDRNCLGGRLRADGALYAKGLGMHSTSRLAYELDGDYQTFQAELALDDAAGARGSVICRVFTAGENGAIKPAYESPILRGGDAPLPISIDLAGVTRLALIVDFAERGDELDHINWLNARLIK